MQKLDPITEAGPMFLRSEIE